MFWTKKQKKTIELYAPITGTTVALNQVPDQVFAQKMMGDGIAFEPETQFICAPCDGTIAMLANTLHAVGITAANGAEILIHIGLDTVNLNGEGFKALVSAGDKVSKGTALIEIDMTFMKAHDMTLTTPMVITNSSEYKMVVSASGNHVIMGEDKVISFD